MFVDDLMGFRRSKTYTGKVHPQDKETEAKKVIPSALSQMRKVDDKIQWDFEKLQLQHILKIPLPF